MFPSTNMLDSLLSLLTTRPVLSIELHRELSECPCPRPAGLALISLSTGSLLGLNPNTPPVPTSVLLELILSASHNLSVAPLSAWSAVVEILFCDYERLTGVRVERFDVPVPCSEEEFEHFCAELALCGRNAIELLRASKVSSPTHDSVGSSEYSEADSDSDASVSGDELLHPVQHSPAGPDAAVRQDTRGRSDDG